jgi:D-alanyl-D-alanine carboxypeptidase
MNGSIGWSRSRSTTNATVTTLAADSGKRRRQASGSVTAKEERDARAVAAGVDGLTTGAWLRPTAKLRVGSITKTFVATVVLQLVEERRLRLDAPVDTWLPGLLPDDGAITIRHLLQHTSGLTDYVETPGFTEGLLENPIYEPEELVALATDGPLEFPPGTDFAYSNTGYVVAGLLVEAVTGNSLGRELRNRIFGPLGLEHTSSPASGRKLGGYHARGYVPGDRASTPQVKPLDVTEIDPSWAWGAGTLVSDAADVSRFYRSLLSGRLLEPGLLEEMRTTVADPEGGGEYGLGIARVQTPCGAFWGHEGALPGYVTWALTTENAQRSVVLAVTMNPMPPVSRAPISKRCGSWLVARPVTRAQPSRSNRGGPQARSCSSAGGRHEATVREQPSPCRGRRRRRG